ncbi:AraC family transcriptional regulator [Gluconacetobacter sacchari DSM 12717]|uniref:GlxA family transcriptional regulator n=2 Tax=Gluconacetobacter sacchari TaxID=92759 RepID=A0A7W4NRM7_9PROT|nr:GlxA family transcriptional regulator [Gluconacetobacter sacchari]MBB2160350.1 GlxA family transcriptional regulator [Gluconacetobacter sacchari]GBQ33728.1 AraC family transcriptional regulator [Gluconacetobacter sacchari DSM 12717]
MSHIGFFICANHRILDLAGPLGAFEEANVFVDRDPYRLTVISEKGGTVVGSAGVSIPTRSFRDMAFDTVIFIGGDIQAFQNPDVIAAAKDLAARTARVASVCTGAFLLAETGFLDGRRATTHWRLAPELQQRYPSLRVEADRIFISDDKFWTSAGISAGIDLALALIETDRGPEIARAVARELVVPYRRSGGQSQFSAMSQMEPESDRIRMALAFARDHLVEPLPIERLAEAARLSVRQFGRAFRRQTGETPARAVERLRVEAACVRLRNGSEPIEQIAKAIGFADPERMRRAFVKLHGHPPQAIRRAGRQESAV